MKAGMGIVALFLSVSICFVTCNDRGADNIDEKQQAWNFAKYYDPYEPDIEPNAPGYNLPLDINDVVNFTKIDRVFKVNSVSSLIRQNGFAVLEPPDSPFWDDIKFVYKNLSTMGIPVFVTTDILLHIYHVQFEWTLREIEEREFASDINDMTSALLNYSLEMYGKLDGDLKEAARRNVAYLSVA